MEKRFVKKTTEVSSSRLIDICYVCRFCRKTYILNKNAQKHFNVKHRDFPFFGTNATPLEWNQCKKWFIRCTEDFPTSINSSPNVNQLPEDEVTEMPQSLRCHNVVPEKPQNNSGNGSNYKNSSLESKSTIEIFPSEERKEVSSKASHLNSLKQRTCSARRPHYGVPYLHVNNLKTCGTTDPRSLPSKTSECTYYQCQLCSKVFNAEHKLVQHNLDKHDIS